MKETLARIEFASQHAGLTKPDVLAALRGLCQGRRSFKELELAAKDLIPMLQSAANPQLLNEIAPQRVRLPSGRQTRIHYDVNKPPWVASRLQDFFGLKETPRIANGKVALVLHLLAPNQRPVQTTTDLAGFWQRLYPTVRRELMRRYPKHAWPKDPLRLLD